MSTIFFKYPAGYPAKLLAGYLVAGYLVAGYPVAGYPVKPVKPCIRFN